MREMTEYNGAISAPDVFRYDLQYLSRGFENSVSEEVAYSTS
jgi:hypothetical protein